VELLYIYILVHNARLSLTEKKVEKKKNEMKLTPRDPWRKLYIVMLSLIAIGGKALID